MWMSKCLAESSWLTAPVLKARLLVCERTTFWFSVDWLDVFVVVTFDLLSVHASTYAFRNTDRTKNVDH